MTGIIMTMGPATTQEQILTKCYRKGVRILRFNFPHYNQSSLQEALRVVRKVEKKLGKKFSLLLDTEWPQVRTGVLSQAIEYHKGEKFRIVAKESKRGDRDLVCDYPWLIKDAKIGTIIRIDSGLLEVRVEAKWSESLVVQALNTYTVGSRRHINTPGIHYNLPTLTKKDLSDIAYAITQWFSYIAVSFTRSQQDIQGLRKFLNQKKWKQIQIIAKIENQEWIDQREKIAEVSDMIMVARGDLWAELPIPTIPVRQMRMIKLGKIKNTPVIVATQMLESMINNPVPTRAEVSDVFYAVREGAEYVMLSGETAIGKYPLECIQIMNEIITEAKKYK